MKLFLSVRNKRLALAALLVCATMCFASDAQPPAHPEMLVSTQWLAAHLNDPKVVILQADDERTAYEKGHIPGARLLQTQDFVVGHQGLMDELPSAQKLKEAFEKLGVNDDSRVIIYTSEWYPGAARAYFTLDYLGHENTALLDGSIEQWKAENRALSTESPAIIAGTFTPHVNQHVRALLADAKAAAQNDSSTLLVDSRPERRYKQGHLPGAVPIFWEETVSNPKDPVFLSPEKLRALFVSRGVTPGHKVITYCEVGLQASHNYFVAKYLGYDAAMYDGSFYEWNDIEHLPLVKGASRR
jgi:thiosulfate/3-mercaptopyruvate sulfurtransferase